MATALKQPLAQSTPLAALKKQRSYNEVIEFLDTHWRPVTHKPDLTVVKALDTLFKNPSQKIAAITITGSNGKSLTAHFTAQLFQNENLKVGSFLTPHINLYNERIALNNENISNKLFAEHVNEVINAAQSANVKACSEEILLISALNYFIAQGVDVVLLEAREGASSDITAICSPKILAITRVTGKNVNELGVAQDNTLYELLSVAPKNTHIISADQNKTNLKTMETWSSQNNCVWEMPVRKLAPLKYPFEQLHGRCAALAERIVSIFINQCMENHDEKFVQDSLLAKKKGQRGRPTLAAKSEREKNPIKTVENFWKEAENKLSAKFEILDKEKTTILLDNAHNEDALENFLLGIRLYHYQKPLKGLTIILACNEDEVHLEHFSKQIRYFFKKTTSGNVIVCGFKAQPGEKEAWDAEAANEALKNVKVKSRTAISLKEAVEIAKKSITDRHGLIAISGPASLIKEFWDLKK